MKKLNNFSKKLLTLILTVTFLISTVNIVFILTSAAAEPAVNYPLLNDFTEGSAPAKDSVWTYGVRDFAEKAVFEISTEGFEAPLADWYADDSYAKVNWQSFTDADEYILNIYEDIRKIHSINLQETEWKSSQSEPLEGGETYELQVLALKNGTQIAASAVRSFKAYQAQKVAPYYINAFNSESDLDSVTFSRFESKSISDNRLVMKTKSNESLARIYLETEGIVKAKAKAVVFFIKTEEEMLQTFRVAFGETNKSLLSTTSGQSDNVYYVSGANPNNTVVSAVSSTTTSKDDLGYSKYCDGGYYVVIPLSLYDESIRTGIAEGKYKYCEILLQNIKYKDSNTGNFTSSATNFNGTDITFDNICLIDDIDGFIKQLRQEYNKVNDPDKYNQILKEELEATAYPYTGGVSGVGSVVIADEFDNNTLINKTADTGYTLYDSKAARKVVFTATSKTSFKYGSHLKFTASKDGIYDLGGTLRVENNSDVTDAEVKYRVVHIDSKQKETVISGDGDWLSINVTSDELNPVGSFPVSQVALKKGEAVAIEVYQTSAEDDTALNISLGNPTVTAVMGTSNYNGSSTTYNYSDYSDNRVFHSDGSNIGKHSPIMNRWNLYIIRNKADTVEYTEINTLRSGWKMLYNDNIGTTGYYYESGKVQVKNSNAGIAFEFISPDSGNATISVPLKSSSAGMYARVLKNGERIYPANTDWEELSTGKSELKAVCDVKDGDVISIEFYGTSSSATCLIDSTPSITVADAKDANNLDDTTFSPLWERPYGDSSYVGECVIPEGSVWNYEILKTADKTVATADYYDSYSKMLYKKDMPDCGYIFEEESLKFAFGDGSGGMSLVFNVPARGYYDFSSFFEISKGAGRIKLRILKNDETVWPKIGGYEEFTESIAFDAMEIGAVSGDKIIIEAYAENCSNACLTMATPVVQRLLNRQYTQVGNVTVYNPKDYTAFENGYKGSFRQLNSRFIYFLNGNAPTQSDSAEKKLIYEDSSLVFDDGKISISANGSATIKYTSIMAGNGNISYSISGAGKVRVLQNTEVLSDWKTGGSYSLDAVFNSGDVISFEFEGNIVTVEALNISVTGLHNNTNSPEDNGFYAAYADPYSDEYYSEEYDGGYEKNDSEYWNFDFYDSKKDEIKTADSYSTAENHKIYAKDLENTGYYFADVLLTADLNVKDGYGVALGFSAPRTDIFNSRYGLRLITETAEAVIKTRMIKISAESGDIEQIWPKEGWSEKTVKTDEDVTVPYAELSLKKGDKVYMEVYSSSANTDKITVNLVSPAFIKESVVNIDNSDIKAKIYNAHDYGPYSYIENYNGSYIPMDNRWNFRFAEFGAEGSVLNLFDADFIRTDTNNEHSYYSSLNSIPQFVWNTVSKMVTVRSYVSAEKNTGAVMEFVCPYSGSITFTAAPSLDTVEIEGATLKYRITKKSITDGNTSVVWPKSGEWETLDSSNIQSGCMEQALNVELGDVLEFKYYWDVPSEKIKAYLADNEVTFWRPSFAVTPQIIASEWINTDRISFDAVTQFIPDYLVSPYWRVQYSIDENNIDWKYATQYKNIYWQSNTYKNIGISKNSLYAIEHTDNSFGEYNPVLAWLFTSKHEGTVKMSGTKVISVAKTSTEGYSALIRITVNNEQVYPDAGWTEVTRDKTLKLKDVSFEVKEGDEIRFEVKSSKYIENDHMLRLAWTPAFTISDEINIYSQTDDIYNMLDSEMYEVFKGLDGSQEFDMDMEKNKLLSCQIKDWLASLVPFDYGTNQQDDKKEVIYSEGDYSEWTEEIYTPGGGWKKTIRYIKTAWWVYALIIGGCVVAAGGITVSIIIIVKKKKSKKLQESN